MAAELTPEDLSDEELQQVLAEQQGGRPAPKAALLAAALSGTSPSLFPAPALLDQLPAEQAQSMLSTLRQQQSDAEAQKARLQIILDRQQRQASDMRTTSLLTSMGANPLLQGLTRTSGQMADNLENVGARTEQRLVSAKSGALDPLRLITLQQAAERLKLAGDQAAKNGALADQRLGLGNRRLSLQEQQAEARAAAAKEKAQAKAEADQQKQEQGGFKLEGSLRKEVTSSPAYKNYQIAAVALDQIQRAVQDPSAAGDLALITNFMRSLDPNTGVKDQEFNNAQNAGGMYDKAAAALAHVQSGQRLTQEQRAEFLNAARSNVSALKRPYDVTLQKYQGFAKDYKVSPERVAVPLDYNLEAPSPAPRAAAQPAINPRDFTKVVENAKGKFGQRKDGSVVQIMPDGSLVPVNVVPKKE